MQPQRYLNHADFIPLLGDYKALWLMDWARLDWAGLSAVVFFF